MNTMPKKQIMLMSKLRGTVCRQHIEAMFLYYASPVLRKVKPAALIPVNAQCVSLWKAREKAMRKASGLYMTELKNKHNSSLFLIYDRYELESVIKNERSISILSELGYKVDGDTDELIEHLSYRLSNSDFPHEVGLFLGYPPGDVKAYIENEGKNYACCRYWKVYEDVGKAKEIWAKIDEAQSRAIDILLELPPIHIAVNLIKTL